MPFPQRSVPTLERQAPCGGLTGLPNHSLPKGQPEKKKKKIKSLSSQIQHAPSISINLF